MARQSVDLPETVKRDLESMANDFGITQNGIVNMAVRAMVDFYSTKGSQVFFHLIAPTEKSSETLTVNLAAHNKKSLEAMCSTQRISQNSLICQAVNTIVSRYKQKGSKIIEGMFVD